MCKYQFLNLSQKIWKYNAYLFFAFKFNQRIQKPIIFVAWFRQVFGSKLASVLNLKWFNSVPIFPQESQFLCRLVHSQFRGFKFLGEIERRPQHKSRFTNMHIILQSLDLLAHFHLNNKTLKNYSIQNDYFVSHLSQLDAFLK